MHILSTDIDGTIYESDTDAEIFASGWTELSRSLDDTFLIYNTGRSAESVEELVGSTSLPSPDLLISDVGTTIHSEQITPSDWESHLIPPEWDRERIDDIVVNWIPDIERQPARCQSEAKISYYWHDAQIEVREQLSRKLTEEGLPHQLIYSSNKDFDILPPNGGKGGALRWVCESLGFSLRDAVVAGDSGNDSAMFELPDVQRIIPANAHADLLFAIKDLPSFQASGACATGVIEGLEKLWQDTCVSR